MKVVEVFADVGCPFTHVGLLQFVEARAAHDRPDVVMKVRSWPLEVVNGAPLDAAFIAEEIREIRPQLSGGYFGGFDERRFPHSSIPAMALAAAAYELDDRVGEAVSLELRDLLFERGMDIASPEVLAALAERHGVGFDPSDGDGHLSRVMADHDEGAGRGVIGSPHFFTPSGDFFCPALDVSRDDRGHLRVVADPEGFAAFLADCLA